MNKTKVPAFHEMMRELFQAVKELGGSGSVNELNDKTIEILDLPQDVQEVMHGNTGRTEVEYRLAWARTYMKKYGILENSERGIWALTSKGSDLQGNQPGRNCQRCSSYDRARIPQRSANESKGQRFGK